LSSPGSFFSPGQFIHRDGATLYRRLPGLPHAARSAQERGHAPALAANPKLASPSYPVLTVLNGRRGRRRWVNIFRQQVAES
jgi:hypothetical protein